MKIRWIQTEDTPLRYVLAGAVADTPDEVAKGLIAAGVAILDEIEAERAVRPRGSRTTKK